MPVFRFSFIGLSLALLFGLLSPTEVQPPVTTPPGQILTASDGAAEHNFGEVLATDGETLLVGAFGVGDNQGAVYVYERDDAGSWVEAGRLSDPEGAAGDYFGMRLTLRGDQALIGAYGVDESRGAAYVYERDEAGNWAEAARLMAEEGDIYEYFGSAVALSEDGETAFIGAYWTRVDDQAIQGAVYVFERGDDGTWAQVARLTGSDGRAGDHFGSALAVEGNTLDVSAVLATRNDNAYQGTAYVFEYDGANWVERAVLMPDDAGDGDVFGGALALRDGLLLIGAHGKVDADGAERGKVYVFERDATGVWQPQGAFTSDDPGARSFGYALAFDGKQVLIGAPRSEATPGIETGAGYLFARDGEEWLPVAVYRQDDLAQDARLGNSAVLTPLDIILGAHEATVDGLLEQGSAAVFERE